jgi:hypothetical protein
VDGRADCPRSDGGRGAGHVATAVATALSHRHLVAQHEQLDVLGCAVSGELDNICRTWRSSKYANEAFMASIVPATSMSGSHTAAPHGPN